MTSSDMVNVLMSMFRDYFGFLLPAFGVIGGLHFIFRALWGVTFKPFVR